MRFLIDECTGPEVAEWLLEQGHDVFSVFHSARGLDDEAIIEKAFRENRVLITNDKGFGLLVFLKRIPRHGVILL